ncbi:MAG: hypothetical protein SGJ17_07265 [Hyphomicrobiales bacterium]|nr:hypothetical protein [Hyphomicrobiales bacterium]
MNVLKSGFSISRTIAALSIAALAAGCAEGMDVDFNAPILEAAGINLSSKKAEGPDLPDRPGIVMPPSKDRLPEPGERNIASAQQWPNDPDLQRKADAAAAIEKETKYCREGDWSGKGGIEEFDRTTGRAPRCRAQYVKDAIKKNEEANAAIEARNNAPEPAATAAR